MLNLASHPTSDLCAGALYVPGDKSVTHRALILASLADGRSEIRGWLDSADCRATLNALGACGVRYSCEPDGLCIDGVGLRGLSAPEKALDCGNSGTAMRLLSGVLCAQDFASVLTGDVSLSQRPMLRVMRPLREMGADIQSENSEGHPPLYIRPAGKLKGIEYHSPLASAQVKSCLMLAGLYADAGMTIHMPAPTRDHTERMMEAFGAQITTTASSVGVRPGGLRATDVRVPGDFSSAAFFIVAASVVPGSNVLIKDVGVNPTRIAALDILSAMGADINLHNRRRFGAEPVADIRVRSASLKGVDIPRNLVASAIDEFPVLFIAAACASGVTRLRGAAELRVKESDRLAVMARGLETCGVKTQIYDDGLDITGGTLTGGRVSSAHDHRVSMAFLVAGAVAGQSITVEGCDNIRTSFPGFPEAAAALNMRVERVV